MDPVSGSSSAQRYFNDEEEEALRKDESTNNIVKRDGKSTQDISGTDRTWRQEKEHQKGDLDGLGKHLAHTGAEGAEMFGASEAAGTIGVTAVGTSVAGVVVGVGMAIGGPIAGFYLGAKEIDEAHEDGDKQAKALAQDTAHVALISALDLPTSYKADRLDNDFKDTAKGPNTTSGKMTQDLMASKRDLSVLQLHADRGMNAARDSTTSGMTKEAYLAANPKTAEAYKNDAAFKEGFDAYRDMAAKQPGVDAARDFKTSGFMTKDAYIAANPKAAEAYKNDAAFKTGFDSVIAAAAKQPPAAVEDLQGLDKKLDDRDARYSQSHVQLRV